MSSDRRPVRLRARSVTHGAGARKGYGDGLQATGYGLRPDGRLETVHVASSFAGGIRVGTPARDGLPANSEQLPEAARIHASIARPFLRACAHRSTIKNVRQVIDIHVHLFNSNVQFRLRTTLPLAVARGL